MPPVFPPRLRLIEQLEVSLMNEGGSRQRSAPPARDESAMRDGTQLLIGELVHVFDGFLSDVVIRHDFPLYPVKDLPRQRLQHKAMSQRETGHSPFNQYREAPCQRSTVSASAFW